MNIACLIFLIFSTAAQASKPFFASDKGSFITKGKTAQQGYFPYQAALSIYYPGYNGGNGFCGGFVISKDYLVTAAHCLDGAEDLIGYLGATDLNTVYSQQGVFIFYVSQKNFIIHKDYNAKTLQNDIALVRIEPSVDFERYPNIKPVSLPEKNDKILYEVKTVANYFVNVSGFGMTTDSTDDISMTLQYATFEVITRHLCRLNYRGFDTCHICVETGKGISACRGDSGGPLTTKDNIVIGIVSYGSSEGCQENYPVAFSDIFCFLDWIKTKTNEEVK